MSRLCITPHALRSLADRLDQLGIAHARAGGAPTDAPCAVSIAANRDGRMTAEVLSGGRKFSLAYNPGDGWTFL